MEKDAVIEFVNVSKKYSDTNVVDNISFMVRRGDALVLVGPSGCGKSTTLKMINRLVEATIGRVLVYGQDVMIQDPIRLRRRMGYVIQEGGLFPHMTVRENISLLPTLEGWNKNKTIQRMNLLLEKVHLEPTIFADRYPTQLSGGQAQRVGIVRALMLDPPILLMDEPFGALDPLVREELQEEIVGLLKQSDKTVVFVTHDINEALKMADVIAVMNGGKIVQLANPQDILKKPKDEFIRNFVGSDKLVKLLKISTVKEICNPSHQGNDVDVIDQDASGLEALETMLERKRTYLSIVDKTGSKIGTVSFDDMLRFLHGD